MLPYEKSTAAVHRGVQYSSIFCLERWSLTARHRALLKLKRNLRPGTTMAMAAAVQRQLGNTNGVVPTRRSGNYGRSSWADFLVSLDTVDDTEQEETLNRRIPTLQENISSWLKVMSTQPSAELLELVDTIQQLGLGYRFREEIKIALDQVTINMTEILVEKDLYTTSLLFRVLRENGYSISEDIFSILASEEGDHASFPSNEIKEMISLYEASFYASVGENILENAKIFTHSKLRALTCSHDKSFEKEKLIYALEQPIHWRLPRLHNWHFINMYCNEDNMQPELLKLAKLDFARVQYLHRRDLKELADWWSKLGLAEKMPYARERLVEMFLFAVGMQSEPQYGHFRVEVTKICILITVIDDLYDVYGTLEELELFTEMLERWDVIAALDCSLPDDLKVCFMALFNTVNEMAYATLRDKGMNVTRFLNKMWVNHCKAYLAEAKWYHGNHVPKLSEYLEVAGISIGNPLLVAYYCVLDGKVMTEKEMEFIVKLGLVHWSSLVSRLVGDLGTAVNERKRGDVAKAAECYMHHEGVSETFARTHINSILNEAWKNINRDRFCNTDVPKTIVDAIINHSRAMQSIYLNGDGVGFPGESDRAMIASLLVEIIPDVNN